MSEDEQPVAQDVQHVAQEHNPHRHGRVLHAVAELFVGVEHHLRQQAQHQDKQIGTHQGQQLDGLPQAWQEDIKQACQQHQQQADAQAGKESVLQPGSDVVHPALSQKRTNDGSDAVGEAHTTYNEQGNDVIHETSCSQFVRAIMSYHKRIGEPHHDGAQLPQHDWHADAQKVGVIVFS